MKVVVIYESTRGRTKSMADAIAEGVVAAGKECEVVDAKDFNGIGDACAIAVGSSTRMKHVLPKVKQVLSGFQSLNGIPAAAYGSYGWSGEAPGIIAKQLEEKGAKLVEGQPISAKDYPNEETLNKCKDLGKTLADACR
ncbi:MAG: flavodoxin domain-containing protein [Candidatus Thorarchaeota archaeon]|nr:flavodoxin domain-containing protein [Candidatus Thorarchaeota archaeon]